MLTELVDPRDVSWEVDQPEFRVLLYQPSGEHAAPDAMFVASTHRLTDCSVSQALTWARDHSLGGYVLYLIVRSNDRVGTVRLEGEDPTEGIPAPINLRADPSADGDAS